MIHPNSLLNCQSVNQLDQFIGEIENCRMTIGPWGGRKYFSYAQNPAIRFSINELVSQLLLLAEKPVEEAQTLLKLIQKIRRLDAMPDPKVSIVRRILTAVRRFFGNFFFNRNALLNELEQKLPAAQPVKEKPPEPILKKPFEPIPLPIPQPPQTPAKTQPQPQTQTPIKTIKERLSNPVEGPKTTAFYMNIKEVMASPYSKPNETVEGLLKQCTDDQTINLQNEHALLLLEGIFSHCIVDKIVTKYSPTKVIDIFDWLSRQPTFNHQSLDAALRGHLAHRTPNFSSLFELVKCIQRLRMKEAPASLGQALAKMVQLDVNSNPFEQLFKNLLKAGHIKQPEYVLILNEFKLKRADPSKANCQWNILNWLQEHARKEGWQ